MTLYLIILLLVLQSLSFLRYRREAECRELLSAVPHEKTRDLKEDKATEPCRFDGWKINALSLSPDGGKAALTMTRLQNKGEDKRRLFILDLKSRKANPLITDGTPRLTETSWSPDGKRIVYAKVGNGIRLVNVEDGSETSIGLGRADLFPSFSTRSEEVLFSRIMGESNIVSTDLWLMDLKTGKERTLVSGNAGTILGGVWSPDGRKIYYLRRPLGRKEETTQESIDELWKVDRDGTGNVCLTPGFEVCLARPSPDGRRILVRTPFAPGDLWLIDTDSGGRERLTEGRHIIEAAWLSDGKRIAFLEKGDIYLLPLEPGRVQQLTKEGIGSSFVVSPDGMRLYYWNLDSVWVMNFDGSNRERVFP